MPSPGSLQRLRRPRNAALHTVAECDQQLERLADLARAPRLQVRVDALRRIDDASLVMRRVLRRFRRRLWLAAHRLERRYGGEMRHAEDRATRTEWGPLG
jgi:hypothetical protein